MSESVPKMASFRAQDYYVGWVCALPREFVAAIAMLDERHEDIPVQDPQDHNSCILGCIHKHNVVIACLPLGVDGLVSAAHVAKDMARTFPAIRAALLVGIGGGIPNLAKGIDIRLGDIIVSKPEGTLAESCSTIKGRMRTGESSSSKDS
jgi:nucleoside phosphorylase